MVVAHNLSFTFNESNTPYPSYSMLVFAGIDEAGYGPMIGPLCVGCSVFVLKDYDPAEGPPNLWRMLRAAVCRKATDKKRRVAIDDSKNLKGPRDAKQHPLRHLERGVWSFCPFPEPEPGCDGSLFDVLETTLTDRPWFDSTTSLPIGQTSDELRIARSRVARALERTAISCEMLGCETIDAGNLNSHIRSNSNKAAVNFSSAVKMIDRIWQRWPSEHPRIIIDRHGGRTRYGPVLAEAFTDATVTVVAETPTMSRYILKRRNQSQATVTFAVDGDAEFLPVALASMTAKFTRELVMIRLNRYFQNHLPELKPTAGYFADGRRFFAEIDPLVRRLRIDRNSLIRMR